MTTIPIFINQGNPSGKLSHSERRALVRTLKKLLKKSKKNNRQKMAPVYQDNRLVRRLLKREEKKTFRQLERPRHKIIVSNELRTPINMLLAKDYAKKIDFVNIINQSVQWDPKQWNVSPGHLALSIVLSTFTQIRFPLYLIKDNFDGMDMELLFCPGVTQDMLNDDALGRMLDRIYDVGCNGLSDKLILNARAAFKRTFESLHSDTSSVSLYGRYAECESPDYTGIDITLGFSKAHRPDLKQFMIGNVVDQNGIPLYARTLDGNTADTEWNKKTWPKLIELYGDQLEDKIYIGDSKAVTLPNIMIYTKPGTKMLFLSRCPDSFYKKLADKVKQQAYFADNWIDLGSVKDDNHHTRYEGQEFCEIVRGLDEDKYREISVRLFVIRAQDGESRIAKSLEKEEKQLKNDVDAMEKKAFSCCEDAQKAAAEFVKTRQRNLIDIQAAVRKEETTSQGRGRPGKTSRPLKTKITWHVNVRTIGPNSERVLQSQQKAESFVLITNAPSDRLDIRSALIEYKAQYHVETGFRVIKTPALAGEIFLKKPKRIQALAMLLEVALLIRRLMQSNAREREKVLAKYPRIDFDNRELKNPTYEHLAKLLQPIEVITKDGKYHYRIRGEMDRSRLEYILDLLKIPG